MNKIIIMIKIIIIIIIIIISLIFMPFGAQIITRGLLQYLHCKA